MTLWRVDVCGVSHRFVDAESKDQAEALVVHALVEAMDVRATRAEPSLARAFEFAGPIRRRTILAYVDGLTNPQERRTAKAARRRLARLIKYELQERDWIREQARQTPPLSPDAVDALVRLQEVLHVERNFSRLPTWDRASPIHGE
jgi:hypothetical protein